MFRLGGTWSAQCSVVLLYGASASAAGLSLLQSKWRQGQDGLVVTLFCVSIVVGIQYLRYQEFGIVARWFRLNGIRATVKSHLRLRHYEESLRPAATPDECWRACGAG